MRMMIMKKLLASPRLLLGDYEVSPRVLLLIPLEQRK